MGKGGAIARSKGSLSGAGAMLTISSVTRSFYGVAALRGVDLEIREGTMTGLIGPNGAGKSTLFNIVSGQFAPDGGTVTFAGREITGKKPHLIVREGLIRTFQLARGFPKLSVFQHLMLYGPRQAGESLWAATVCTAAARRGEQELAERAWATARRLRLDEPMAGVNPTLTGEIAEHLIALNRAGITICLIEHDMALIRELCDPVIVMAEGKTLTMGTFAEVAADGRVQEAYLGRRH